MVQGMEDMVGGGKAVEPKCGRNVRLLSAALDNAETCRTPMGSSAHSERTAQCPETIMAAAPW
jgi:hypothetical protein